MPSSLLSPGRKCLAVRVVVVQRLALSRQEIMFLVGVALVRAVLLLFNPAGDPDTIYLDL